MTSLISGADAASVRWSAFVQKAQAGSVQSAEMPFRHETSQQLSGAGLDAKGLGTVVFKSGKAKGNPVPDEQRVARDGKEGRIMKVAPVAPPKSFNAGTIFERTSQLTNPGIDPELRMAFVEPGIKGREVEIASSFQFDRAKAQPDPTVPTFLASLVTSQKADVLATAYAPAEPNYAKASPFESLLQEADPNGGRFVPPVTQGDHAWMSTPLPAEVFSEPEQTCLANAVYFESRGENTRGQAAVAQVVLNRVRNPAYPKSICGVVYQNQDLRNRCQFSFACDGIKDRITNQAAYAKAKDIAMAVTAGKVFIPEIGSSTHYYAEYVSPSWARTMEKMKQIGKHIFYRTYGGGWS
ncbi:MAG: cell wall hydrolase [Methylobacterium mesophilicum]|nr:cell wall hydrolase [Methylobacterium mesophilicum]